MKVWARAPQAEGTLKGLAGERNREEGSVWPKVMRPGRVASRGEC